MNRDISGVGGQFVTEWGSVVRDGMVVSGTHQDLTTTLTCRCGVSVKFPGWPLSTEIRKRTTFVSPSCP